ncbi:MAG: hypothetical protein PVJ72_17015 [Gammaproteobacteria bacterium]|jgi:hypothetical protein
MGAVGHGRNNTVTTGLFFSKIFRARKIVFRNLVVVQRSNNMKFVPLIPWLLAIFISGCAQTPESYDVLYGLSLSKQHFLGKLLILPADIRIQERFPGDLYEDIPLWANKANHAVVNELATMLNTEVGIGTIQYQATENKVAVERHIPLIKSVARAVRVHSRGFDLWSHKMEQFDYTVGPGLNALKHKNIDAALFVAGYQSVEAFRYDDTKPSIYTYRKQDLSFGDLYLTLILIDSNSGDLLWTCFGSYSNIDLRNNAEVQAALSNALVKFPIKIFEL